MSWRALLRSLVGFVLVDVPLLVAAAIAGSVYGYRDTVVAVFEWRRDHPASYAVSLVLLLMLAARYARRGRA